MFDKKLLLLGSILYEYSSPHSDVTPEEISFLRYILKKYSKDLKQRERSMKFGNFLQNKALEKIKGVVQSNIQKLESVENHTELHKIKQHFKNIVLLLTPYMGKVASETISSMMGELGNAMSVAYNDNYDKIWAEIYEVMGSVKKITGK